MHGLAAFLYVIVIDEGDIEPINRTIALRCGCIPSSCDDDFGSLIVLHIMCITLCNGLEEVEKVEQGSNRPTQVLERTLILC
jgi:hypothetical protein